MMLTCCSLSFGLNFAMKSFRSRLLIRRYLCTAKSSETSVDPREVKKFDSTSSEWWNGQKYSLLHSMNSVRIPLIRDGILSMSGHRVKSAVPLKGYEILDVGCGGGILSEPLARLGASVTGLDPGSENVKVAIEHASHCSEIKDRLSYVCDTVENFATSGKTFDAVVCSEVVEHVSDVELFIHSCVKLTKENGSLYFTTINRTPVSYILSILIAEYIMGLMPQGTHDWNKFVKPSELNHILESHNCHICLVQGFIYNPFMRKFGWSNSNANLYAVHAVK